MDATYPRVRLLDRRFQYTNAAQTDIRVTFERARRALIEEKLKEESEDSRLKLVKTAHE